MANVARLRIQVLQEGRSDIGVPDHFERDLMALCAATGLYDDVYIRILGIEGGQPNLPPYIVPENSSHGIVLLCRHNRKGDRLVVQVDHRTSIQPKDILDGLRREAEKLFGGNGSTHQTPAPHYREPELGGDEWKGSGDLAPLPPKPHNLMRHSGVIREAQPAAPKAPPQGLSIKPIDPDAPMKTKASPRPTRNHVPDPNEIAVLKMVSLSNMDSCVAALTTFEKREGFVRPRVASAIARIYTGTQPGLQVNYLLKRHFIAPGVLHEYYGKGGREVPGSRVVGYKLNPDWVSIPVSSEASPGQPLPEKISDTAPEVDVSEIRQRLASIMVGILSKISATDREIEHIKGVLESLKLRQQGIQVELIHVTNLLKDLK